MPKLYWLLFSVFLCFRLQAQSIEELNIQLKKAEDSVEIAKIISRMGNAHFEGGDLVSASACFFRSLKIAERFNDELLMATNYNNLAATYMETENYPEAERYAHKAVHLNQKLGDHLSLANSYNSLANVYYMLEKDSLSLRNFELSVQERKIINDSDGLFKGYKNLGAVHFEMTDTAAGLHYMQESMKYIKNPADTVKFFSAWLSLAQIYTRVSDLDLAKKYFDKCEPWLAGCKEYNKLEDYYFSLSEYYTKKEDYKSALLSHEQYTRYRDSVVGREKNSQLAELNIQYETEKKQQLIQEQEFEIARKNYWMIGAGIFLVLGGLTAYLLHRNRQYRRVKKLQEEIFLQKELAARALFEGEQNERIRIARDLHDSIGQQLSAVKMKMNALPASKEVEDAGNFLDGTIREVRNISHNLLPEALQFGWVAALEELCEQMNLPNGPAVTLEVDDYSRSYSFSKQQELSIYRIIQEIISNTVKHAEAKNIHISVSGNDNSFLINTSDDGKGMDTAILARSSGIGWKNIAARVNLLRGKMDISSQQMSGTRISIAIPLQ